MHPYIFVYKVTRCNMHNLSAFEQKLCIMEQTYPHPISEIALTSIAHKESSGAITYIHTYIHTSSSALK